MLIVVVDVDVVVFDKAGDVDFQFLVEVKYFQIRV